MAVTRKCPECGDDVRGRADKRFCSDYCRNIANNKLNKDSSTALYHLIKG